MRLPLLFRQIHGDQIFNTWMRAGRPPVVRIVPQEPLGRVSLTPDVTSDSCVTIVSVRCWNNRGTLQFEAASPADLKVAHSWAQRHRATPPEDFKWFPKLGSVADREEQSR